jgi:hypothetical protein
MAGAAPLEFHPFMAQRFEQAVLPALAILVVDHDARPLERLVAHSGKADATWLDIGGLERAVKGATEAVQGLPQGTSPQDLIATHDVGKDPHTGYDCIANPPAWAVALNEVAAALCVATARTTGWNPRVLATTDDGETLDQFAAAARRLNPPAFQLYGRLAAGLHAWLQGGPLLGYLGERDVEALRVALTTSQEQTLMWKEKGGDFHRRKVQAFCFVAQKHKLGLAALRSSAAAPAARARD